MTASSACQLCLILQLSELEVLEIVEQLANPSKDEGEWIAKIDLVESGTKLKLVEQVNMLVLSSHASTG